MRRVWCWFPCWYWHGWRTLLPGRRNRPSPEPEDYRCCALDTEGGTGHPGPCGRKCITCLGTGVCPECDGAGPELCGCAMCDTTGTCPDCLGEGWISDEG